MLSDLPTRADAPEGDEKAEQDYCAAMQRVSRVFGKQRRSNSTADEHKQYMRIFDGWLVRKGFGSFVEAEMEHGRCVALHPRRKADGKIKVMKGDLLVGCLLEMATGSKSTPKGGAVADLMSRAATEVAAACGQRTKMKYAHARRVGALARATAMAQRAARANARRVGDCFFSRGSEVLFG